MMNFSRLLAQSLIWRGIYFLTVFFINLLLSRQLGAAGTGTVYYISNTFAFVQLLIGCSFENGITFFAAGKRISTNRLLWWCLLWTAGIILVQVLLYLFVPLRNALYGSKETAQYAFCFVTGMLLTAYSSNVFYARRNFFTSNLVLSLFNLIFILFLLCHSLFAVDHTTIISLYFVTILLAGIAVTFVCVIDNRSWQEMALPTKQERQTFTRYSLTVLLFNVLLFLVYRIDYYFVRYSPVCTSGDLGNYIQASKLGQMLLVIPQIIGSAVYPQVSSGSDIRNVSRIIVLLMKLLALAIVLLMVCVWFTGDRLFPFLFGATFTDVTLPFMYLLPGIYGLSVISFLSNFFSGKGNVAVSVKASCAALLLVVTGDFLFVLPYGIKAAALVSSAAYLLMFSFYLFLFRKEAQLRWYQFFILGKEDFVTLQKLVSKH